MVDDASRSTDDAGEQPAARPLRLALELVAAGYFVAPVVIRRDPRTGKKLGDYLGIRWHAESSTDPAQLRDWWAQYQPSFLVDTGRSGVFAVDLDVPPTGPTGELVWRQAGLTGLAGNPAVTCIMRTRTPGGGVHLWFRAPVGESLTVHKHIHGHPIDVRGDGGHIYAPGAVVLGPGGVPELRGYALDGPLIPAHQLAELPAGVAAFLHATPTGTRKAPTAQGEVRTRSAVVEILRGQLDRISDAPAREGSGFRGIVNGAGVCFGRAIAAGLITEAGARKRLEERVARVWGSVDSDDRRWIRHGLEDGQADPWTVVPDDYDTTVPKSITSTVNPPSVNADRDNGTSVVSSLSNGGAEVEAESGASHGPDAPGRTEDDGLAELEETDSWAPAPAELVDAILDGEVSAPEPAVGIVREDGATFLYPGREHAVIGEMEAGKSWFALACCAAELKAGHRVVYIHFEESDPTSTYLRLHRNFRVERGALYPDRFVFIGPERRISSTDVDRVLAGGSPSLVVLDGQNEAMALHGQKIMEPDGAADYRRKLVKPFTRAGAAVVSLDHVPKDPDGRAAGYAFGSVHKGNGLTGALIFLENREPFGEGRDGVSSVYVTKDRPGKLRKLGRPAESSSSAGRKFYLGAFGIQASTESWECIFRTPRPQEDMADPQVDFLGQERKAAVRLAELDEAVFAAVVELDGKGIEISSAKVITKVGRRKADVTDALYRLEDAGRVKNSSVGQAARWVPSPGPN
jgi:hypothetical protein